MKLELELFNDLENRIKEVVINATREAMELSKNGSLKSEKEWMNLKEAAAYAGVSFNTLSKYREMGLKFTEIDGVKRVSKKAIDEFFIKNSF